MPRGAAAFLSPVPSVPLATVAAALRSEFGVDGTLEALPGERDQNLLLDGGPERFVVKVANAAEDPAVLDLQHAALEHIGRFGGEVAVPSVIRTSGGRSFAAVHHDGLTYALSVQSWLAGAPLRRRPGHVPREEVGATVGRLQRALQGFHHAAAGRDLLWDVRRLADGGPPLAGVGEDVERTVAGVVERVRERVLPRLPGLPAQVIHHDLNPDNLLTDGESITGVVDFGDMLHGPRVVDLAVAAAYQIDGAADPVGALGQVLHGYLGYVRPARPEIEVFADLVAARLCQSILIGTWHAARHPANRDYLLGDAALARRSLASLEAGNADAVRNRLLGAAGIVTPTVDFDTAALHEARRRALAPGLRLSYRTPLHLVSGDGVWLRDAAGRRYLDAYNNVAQAGHGHPLIAETLAAHTRRLNTNTRYLTDPVVDYARRLTELLPDGLDVCYFTTSGSEANDLALRIARTLTGAGGIVVTEHAYHGATAATMEISPEEVGAGRLGDRVATFPPPPEGDAAGALAALERSGRRPAALIVDTIFSSDGIHEPPGSYLDAAAEAIRSAGGLFIADEVQAGLGRVGSRLWGFSAGGAVPDIVTLGKPLGNGHPIGAVVTTAEIAAAFSRSGYFFSTFGGNTVAAAVGLAVLEITRTEQLPERAERVGARIRSDLAVLAADRPVLGAVRGCGLFIGVDVVNPDGGPNAAAAEDLVEAMKARGVLIGRTGQDGNVLKIRPPLVFEEHHGTVLVEALADALG